MKTKKKIICQVTVHFQINDFVLFKNGGGHIPRIQVCERPGISRIDAAWEAE